MTHPTAPLRPRCFDGASDGPPMEEMRDKCGVFGVFGAEGAASAYVALGLHALQHRGQEGCGIVSFHKGRFHQERHLGLVGDSFAGPNLPQRLPGPAAIGHTRYATQGGSELRNVQPLYADIDQRGFAIGHNGNLTNARALRDELCATGSLFHSTSDTECIPQLMAREVKRDIVDRFIVALRAVEGAYALVCLTEQHMIGARDPLGIRPLVLGTLGDAYILASETCALDIVGARLLREVENGEVVVVGRDADGKATLQSYFPFPRVKARPCVFEFVYFARPDSVIGGRSIYDVRKRMGMRLAQETQVIADVVVPVPDSGVPAALGFSRESAIPYELGIVRNQNVGRTFIQPKQEIRALGVRLKHSANRAVIRGKRVVLVDDSIVRGTTSRKIVQIIREAGAAEIHFRSASPPIRWPDFYGIDMPDVTALMAAQLTQQEMKKTLGVDSLGFLSVEGLYWAMGEAARHDGTPQYSDHCFTGAYPTRLVDRDAQRASKEFQATLLA